MTSSPMLGPITSWRLGRSMRLPGAMAPTLLSQTTCAICRLCAKVTCPGQPHQHACTLARSWCLSRDIWALCCLPTACSSLSACVHGADPRRQRRGDLWPMCAGHGDDDMEVDEPAAPPPPPGVPPPPPGPPVGPGLPPPGYNREAAYADMNRAAGQDYEAYMQANVAYQVSDSPCPSLATCTGRLC